VTLFSVSYLLCDPVAPLIIVRLPVNKDRSFESLIARRSVNWFEKSDNLGPFESVPASVVRSTLNPKPIPPPSSLAFLTLPLVRPPSPSLRLGHRSGRCTQAIYGHQSQRPVTTVAPSRPSLATSHRHPVAPSPAACRLLAAPPRTRCPSSSPPARRLRAGRNCTSLPKPEAGYRLPVVAIAVFAPDAAAEGGERIADTLRIKTCPCPILFCIFNRLAGIQSAPLISSGLMLVVSARQITPSDAARPTLPALHQSRRHRRSRSLRRRL